ncbi:MAG: hypothetical protein LWX56_01135 [Ignavibacteria bacterium]|nr:hypothetical protein [Ignavibacteria bacterium]
MTLRIISFLFIFWTGITFSCPAQPDSAQQHDVASKVDSIAITGAKTTKLYIITNELTFSVGDTVSNTTLRYNRERIYSLGIFNQVVVERNKQYPGIIEIVVEETWYLWPLPFVEVVNKDWNKIAWGADVQLKNFQGRNETIKLRADLGYNPGFKLFYIIPYLSRSANLFSELQMQWGFMKNSSTKAKEVYGDDFSFRYYLGYLTIGKRLDKFQKIAPMLGYEWYNYPISSANHSDRNEKILGTSVVGFTYLFDSRDLIQFPQTGQFLSLGWQYKGLFNELYHFGKFMGELRSYFPLGNDVTLKTHAVGVAISTDNVAYHDLVYLGLNERVRGSFKTHQEGTALANLAVEVMMPLIKEWHIKLNLPVLPDELQSFRTAIYPHVFCDAALVKQVNKSLAVQDGVLGYGAGFSFLVLPFRVLSFDLGFNDKGKYEFIFQLDISF